MEQQVNISCPFYLLMLNIPSPVRLPSVSSSEFVHSLQSESPFCQVFIHLGFSHCILFVQVHKTKSTNINIHNFLYSLCTFLFLFNLNSLHWEVFRRSCWTQAWPHARAFASPRHRTDRQTSPTAVAQSWSWWIAPLPSRTSAACLSRRISTSQTHREANIYFQASPIIFIGR